MNILITGGSGFIGTHLCKLLKSYGHTVFNLDIIKSETQVDEDFTINILDKNLLENIFKRYNIDKIIHSCAEVPITKSKNFFNVNLEGTRNILNLFLKYKVNRFVYISSSAVYGVPQKVPVVEGDPRNPAENYGKSKKLGEDECYNLISKGANICIIRPRTVIGGNRLGIFSYLFDWISSGIDVPVLNNGENIYQFVNLNDFCEAVILSCSSEFVGDLNIGSSEYDTIKNNLENLILKVQSNSKIKNLNQSVLFKIANIMQKLNLLPLQDYHFKAYGSPIYFDNSKSKKILKWSTKFSDIQSLKESYDFYLQNNKDNENISLHKKKLKNIIIKYSPKLII